MGCASSKHFQMQAQEHGWNAPPSHLHSFARSFSMPLRSSKSSDRSSFHVVALTSSTYGALKMETGENAIAEGKPRLKQEKVYSPPLTSSCTQPMTKVKVRSATEALEPSDVTDVIDVWELVNDLEEDECSSLNDCSRKKKVKLYGRSFSASQAQKTRKLDEMVYEQVDSSAHIPPGTTDTTKAITANKERYKSRDASTSYFSNSKSIKGLFYGESLFSITELETKKSILEEKLCKVAAISASPKEQSKFCADGYTTPNRFVANDSESLRFNPEILNSVEKSMLCRPTDDDWCYIASDGEFDVSSETESPAMIKCLFPQPEEEHFSGSRASHKKNNTPMAMEPINKTLSNENSSFSKVFALEVEEKKINLCKLEKFEMRCPPGGEERVVLYFTSLRGIRKTYEDCSIIKKVLQASSVKIDERDVSMHSGFRNELKDLLEKPLPVPRLFIKGRYIGGAEEVAQLNEAGLFTKLLEDFPRETSGKACEGCGGMRFIPCPKCSGSCKIVSEIDEMVRCPHCNENGLLRCPICL